MSKVEQNLELASISYRGGNYDEAYSTYSLVIDEEFGNVKAWIGKGLSAGWLSRVDKPTLDECTICLEKVSELGIPNDENVFIASQIVEISLNYVTQIHQDAARFLMEKEKKPWLPANFTQ